MVARTTSQAGSVAALFRWWRAALGRALSSAVAGTARLRESEAVPGVARTVADYVRSPRRTIAVADDGARTVLTALGLTASVTGACIASVLAVRGGASAASAALAGFSPLGWAIVRLALFEALGPDGGGARPSGRLVASWAAALLPYGLAWTPVLRVLAFLTCAPMTYAGLLGAGMETRKARLLCALGFGVEALAGAATWFVGNGLLFAPVLSS